MDRWQAVLCLYAGSSLIAASAGVGAWRRRDAVSAGGPLGFVMFGLAWWSGMEAAQVLVPDGPVRRLGTYLMVIGVGVVAGGFYCQTRALLDDAWKPRRSTLGLLAIHPVVMTVVAMTNPWHQRFVVFREGAGQPWLPYRPGPLFWAHTVYCYLVVTGSLALLTVGHYWSTSPLHRRQVRGILLAALVPLTGNVLTITRPGGWIAPDLTPAFIIVASLIHYYAVFKQGLLRLLPVARELVLENVSDAIFVVDVGGRVIDVNPAGERLARRLDADLPGRLIGVQLRQILPSRRYRRALTGGEYHIDHPDGVIDLDLRISELSDRHSRPLGRVVVARDVTDLNDQRRRLADVNGRLVEQLHIINRLRHELAELAARDELTGLYNRRHLLAALDTELDRARVDGSLLAVLLFDIDHFKSVNDGHGHAVGDNLLVAMSRALSASVRAGDTVARYGGEEFVILLPATSLRQALVCAEMLRRRCATVVVTSRNGQVSRTVSVGVAGYPDCGRSAAVLLERADEALYGAKEAGRDRVGAARCD